MAQRILFVCLGNICRSPAAEGVFRTLCPEVETDSAGTAGYHVGSPPYGPMQAAAGARGINLSDLRARQFKPADFGRFDLIVAMDGDNLQDIEAQRPAGAETPVRLFTDFAAGSGADHVPDPYYTRDFDGCLDLIEAAAQGLANSLR
ncbi:low molecular weight protein-tyrosine-phosphatase [Phaeobacter italicus]|jgi:protein-tyrosine phosphatase|uniref:low molecular weight protein-tyrosine-phosphatase n=1 Tax=Phaeobacter italicus TaxID=481446 RepID=UPI0001870327|nr:low molecular weight protein-tyrosine-phosphatase [Phaeobacter italicus]EEB69512.1 low molecular weight phosphotyrosine protein phosphatase [Ruegeria sp. R11]MBY5976609.1 low molecular weight phosphotyrosine protein phosphatase [Phaeobacter italicus]MBY6044738.1 low molecular weight phosphotyrosine protein phosphatase [Phaeobacter italicus]MCA0855476.1 low molecular weight phosphotyrosine protein phosphatase [Phaeobacter italicus]CRL16665.1 Low molecular weight protein-tyrosine-phosphatase 